MLTQSYREMNAPAEQRREEESSTSVADAVKQAVESYVHEMGDQPINDLYEMVLSEIEAPMLEAVLAHTNNNQSRSASMLGLNRGTLRKKLKKYGML